MNMRTYNLIEAEYDINDLLIGMMNKLRVAVERMFTKICPNLGKKLKDLEQNMFVNDFLYNVLGEQPKAENRNVLSEFFRLNDQ